MIPLRRATVATIHNHGVVIDLTNHPDDESIPLRNKNQVIDLTDEHDDKTHEGHTPKTWSREEFTNGYWRTTLLFDDGCGGLAFGEESFINNHSAIHT